MYLTVHEFKLEYIKGLAFGRGLGIPGLSRAPLNFTMKKKQPRKTPWGAEPGNERGEDTAPLNLRTMLLPDRYEIKIFRSQQGTCMS